jgi:hypothetical protein
MRVVRIRVVDHVDYGRLVVDDRDVVHDSDFVLNNGHHIVFVNIASIDDRDAGVMIEAVLAVVSGRIVSVLKTVAESVLFALEISGLVSIVVRIPSHVFVVIVVKERYTVWLVVEVVEGHPHPTVVTVVSPHAVVVGDPTPRIVRNPGPAIGFNPRPVTVLVRLPGDEIVSLISIWREVTNSIHHDPPSLTRKRIVRGEGVVRILSGFGHYDHGRSVVRNIVKVVENHRIGLVVAELIKPTIVIGANGEGDVRAHAERNVEAHAVVGRLEIRQEQAIGAVRSIALVVCRIV